jgi:hypothetical protein
MVDLDIFSRFYSIGFLLIYFLVEGETTALISLEVLAAGFEFSHLVAGFSDLTIEWFSIVISVV